MMDATAVTITRCCLSSVKTIFPKRLRPNPDRETLALHRKGKIEFNWSLPLAIRYDLMFNLFAVLHEATCKGGSNMGPDRSESSP